jgi:uncharacterized membrane protein
MIHRISSQELLQAQLALFAAIALQVVVGAINHRLLVGQFVIIPTEVILALLIGFTVNGESNHKRGLHHGFALLLLGLISFANITSLMLVLESLIRGGNAVNGLELLLSALAIFMTNIIVFALWYWEIDSPGLTRRRWSEADKDFQFIQQDMKREFPGWQPAFLDYLYVSLTNAINFAPADTRPLTHAAKMLMGLQALVSVFTLALVIARSVTILGL